MTVKTDPLEGIAAARRQEQAAAAAIRAHARAARAAGLSWAQIAGALGCKRDRGTSPAGEAFARLASDLGSGSPSFGFTCGECGQTVIDYGPELAPHDAEQGHAGGCARFAATVAEWDRNWGDE